MHSSEPVTQEAIVLTARQQRERDRKRYARLDHKIKLKQMDEQIAVLEAAAAVIATIGVEDAAWDDFLDDDAKRMRAFLRKTLRLTQEAQQLTHERTVLNRLLREHAF